MMVKLLKKSISRTVLILCLMMSLFTCISGCSVVKDLSYDDPFRELYTVDRSRAVEVVKQQEQTFVTLSAYQMPLPLFCRILSDKYKLGMVYSDTLADRVITAEFKETDLQSVLNVVSRQIGVDIVRVGNTYYIGQLRPEDRGVLVRRVLGYESDSITKIVQPMLSQTGKNNVLSNGVLVVSDHESVLRRVTEMLDYLDSVEPGTWILQLYFVSLRKDAMLKAGFDTVSSGTISYDIASSKVELNDLKLDGVFSFGATSTFADVFASPMMVIRDGSLGKWHDGERVPVPKKSVSDYGTVTTTGFDYVNTGFSVEAKVIESRRGGIVVLNISMSNIKSYVEYSPVTAETSYQLECDLVPEKIYLIGELSTYESVDSQENIGVFGTDRGKTSLQVWAKLYRVASPVNQNYPAPDKFSIPQLK